MNDVAAGLTCKNHPAVSTSLRCNRCDQPICTRCAVSTPIGYRCKECVRGQQKSFETAVWSDYILAAAIAGILSLIGSRLIPFLGFFTIFLTPIAGVIIAETVRRVVNKRRSKRLFQVTAAAAALGSLPLLLIEVLAGLVYLSAGGGGFFLGFIWPLVYTFVITSTVYYRLSGIRM